MIRAVWSTPRVSTWSHAHGELSMTQVDAPPVSNWNVPNALTTLRIVMVPFFGWALLHRRRRLDPVALGRVRAVLAAMITDKIDGDIARKHNLVTNFGKIADPIADKAITGMAFIGLSIIGDIWWWVTIIVLLREWASPSPASRSPRTW